MSVVTAAAAVVPSNMVTLAPAIAVTPSAFVTFPEMVPGLGNAALTVMLPPAAMVLPALRIVPRPVLEKRRSYAPGVRFETE